MLACARTVQSPTPTPDTAASTEYHVITTSYVNPHTYLNTAAHAATHGTGEGRWEGAGSAGCPRAPTGDHFSGFRTKRAFPDSSMESVESMKSERNRGREPPSVGGRGASVVTLRSARFLSLFFSHRFQAWPKKCVAGLTDRLFFFFLAPRPQRRAHVFFARAARVKFSAYNLVFRPLVGWSGASRASEVKQYVVRAPVAGRTVGQARISVRARRRVGRAEGACLKASPGRTRAPRGGECVGGWGWGWGRHTARGAATRWRGARARAPQRAPR